MTEPEYFRGLARHLRATGVRLQGPTIRKAGRDPLSVVNAAVKAVAGDDDYDEVCDHLIVEHAGTGAVVGTYRLQSGDTAAR